MVADGLLTGGVQASLAAAGVSMLGLLSMAALGDWGRRHGALFSAFAIGVLLVAVTFHLTPEAIHQADGAWWPLPTAFVIMSAIGLCLRIGLRQEPTERLAFGFASIAALGFHSFVDGVIYESTFHADAYTGALATAGLLLHEFPEGVIAFFLIRDAGLNLVGSIAVAFLASSLTTVAGAIVAAGVLQNIAAAPVGLMLGAASGALLYVILFHLGPHARLAAGQAPFRVASFGVIVATAAEILHHWGA